MLFKFMNWKLVDTEALNLVYYANHVLLTPPSIWHTRFLSYPLYYSSVCGTAPSSSEIRSSS